MPNRRKPLLLMSAAGILVLLLGGAYLSGCSDDDGGVETEAVCDDNVDNDEDGYTDCDDSDCDSDPACNPETLCNDQIDNDDDGDTDCDDSDCDSDPVCNPETLCNDQIDNDADGDTDCDDSDCDSDPVCNPETLCNDDIDNDEDGDTDCDDPDCDDDPICIGGVTDIEGQVMYYYYTDLVDPPLGLEWGSGAEVTTVGLNPEITATADTNGIFVLQDVPVGEEIYLRAAGLGTNTNAVSYLFTVVPNTLIYLVQATQDLIDHMETAWSVTIDPADGILLGLACQWDPTQDPPFTAFYGNAVVAVDPDITESDFDIIYLNPDDVTDTSLTATDPGTPMFFGLNLPVSGAQFYTLSAQHPTETFAPVVFPIEADTISYVLIHP